MNLCFMLQKKFGACVRYKKNFFRNITLIKIARIIFTLAL